MRMTFVISVFHLPSSLDIWHFRLGVRCGNHRIITLFHHVASRHFSFDFAMSHLRWLHWPNLMERAWIWLVQTKSRTFASHHSFALNQKTYVLRFCVPMNNGPAPERKRPQHLSLLWTRARAHACAGETMRNVCLLRRKNRFIVAIAAASMTMAVFFMLSLANTHRAFAFTRWIVT